MQYAYGTAGDIDIAAWRPTPEKVRRFIAEAEQKDRELQSAIEQQKRLLTGDPTAAYLSHAENLRKHWPQIDQISLDAMIALRMRSNGHSRETIVRTISACSSTASKGTSGQDRQLHAERMAEYAFGLQGTHDMMRNKTYWPMWRKVEGVEEEQRERTRPTWRMR